jgi:hypothetical protein
LDLVKLIYNEYERSTQIKFEGIYDKRVTEIEISLGYRILQIAGIIRNTEDKPFSWARTDYRIVASFAELYRIYYDGKDIDRDRLRAFRDQTKQVARIALYNADTITCTLATAVIPSVADAYYDTEGIGIDKVVRVLESDLWPIL